MLDAPHISDASADSETPTIDLKDDSGPRRQLQDATLGLSRQHPEFSAATGPRIWQWIAALAVAASWAIALILDMRGLRIVVLAAAMAPFAGVIAVRCLVVWNTYWPNSVPHVDLIALSDEGLPRYTILVPMFREARVANQLVRGLNRLDYPTDRLQILLLTEACDAETRSALRASGLADHMQIIVVPEGQPRTKPRALNYALAEATGDYVVVYDAEDEPDSDQLRRAVATFRQQGNRLGCLQGKLKIHNSGQSWFTRQFAIEYAALFGFILPALERFQLPIALGGTSNHFPLAVLQAVGAWDPFNVTEDADLGIRLARHGWRVAVLNSATWEEAPVTALCWFRQRTRWLKGWLQTAIVHTRQPRRLWCELGAKGFVALHVTLASMLLSALAHPLYVASLIYQALLSGDRSAVGVVWWIGLVVFLAGYAISIWVAWIAARSAGTSLRARSVAFIPIYWLLISVAAYYAIYELIVSPFHWNKTPHTGRAGTTAVSEAGASAFALRLPTQEVADQL